MLKIVLPSHLWVTTNCFKVSLLSWELGRHLQNKREDAQCSRKKNHSSSWNLLWWKSVEGTEEGHTSHCTEKPKNQQLLCIFRVCCQIWYTEAWHSVIHSRWIHPVNGRIKLQKSKLLSFAVHGFRVKFFSCRVRENSNVNWAVSLLKSSWETPQFRTNNTTRRIQIVCWWQSKDNTSLSVRLSSGSKAFQKAFGDNELTRG